MSQDSPETAAQDPVTTVKARLHRRFLSRQLDAIFVALKVASSFKHVRNPCDIAATNCIENGTWLTHAILKLQPQSDKNCIELLRQESPERLRQ